MKKKEKIDEIELEDFKEFDIEDVDNYPNKYEVGYKAFNENMKCREKEYKVGEYALEKDIMLCKKGIHYSLFPLDVFIFYPISTQPKICKIIASKISKCFGHKKVTNKIKVLKELSINDLLYETNKFLQNCKDKTHKILRYMYKNYLVNELDESGMITNTLCKNSVMVNNSTTSICHSVLGTNENIISLARNNISVISSGSNSLLRVPMGSLGVINDFSEYCVLLVDDDGYGDIQSETGSNVIIGKGQYANIKGTLGNWMIGIEYDKQNHKIKNMKCAEIDGIHIKPDTYYNYIDGKFKKVIKI